MKLAIHWFRRDLRISDNTALHHASTRAERVLPVFILEDALRTGPDVGAIRLAFLLQSLEALRQNLNHLGYPLIVRAGKSEEEIPKLCAEVGAEAVFANKRYEPYAIARDGRVFRALNAAGVGLELCKDAVIWDDEEILTQSGKPYTVFTPYSKAWKSRRTPPPLPKLRPTTNKYPSIPSLTIPTDPGAFGHRLSQTIPLAGEAAAQRALKIFIEKRLTNYKTNRDFPALAGTSGLSPHLRAGTIGIRTILAKLKAAKPRDDSFLNELIWREFFLQILTNFPHVMRGSMHREFDQLRWENDEAKFVAWRAGQTGYPIVDAAMRCLNTTGWMHNRLRMIVSMFLTKDLLCTWQWGERYFMQQLVDGDMAANNGGWQWSAGAGADAAPYFRIFNPISQSRRFDPDAAFIKRWIPELADIPTALCHEPWKDMTATSQYAKRIVLHQEQRPKCLAMFAALKAPASGSA
jgi:deoxyribodipyrimidine photo-lyase